VDIEFIEKLIATVARSSIEELEMERDGWRVRIAKSARPASANGASSQRPNETAAPPGPVASPAPEAETRRHVVRAMLAGTFYRSATENGPPIVSVGDAVEEGQTLGILEAMKVLNPIEASASGRIDQIFVENGQAVEAGAALFAIVTD
jgi:acetyl-CoA carboxylase biotin carboxyl carrier protein